MRFAGRHHLLRASLVLSLIPLLAAADACSAVPSGSDAGGAGGTGSVSSTSSTGSTSSTSSTSGTGGALACQPGTVVPCYLGPPGTQGVGLCKAGTHACNVNGTAYGPCIGEVLPAVEICDAAMKDEDCDGHPGCECGDGILDPGESCDDGNTMDGDACPATCVRSVSKLFSGAFYNCIRLADGRLKCWGINDHGELGLGDTTTRGDNVGEMGDNLPAVDLGTGKTAVSMAAGNIMCAILNDSSVKCWGLNANGNLGLGDTNNRGDNAGEMGDNLPAVDLGTGKTALAIAGNSDHACAILNDGSLKCWGLNISGELGLGDTNDRGDQPSEMGDNLPAVDLGTGKTAVAIAVGTWHTCAILNDGSVKCWGEGDNGILGLGDTNDRGDQPGEMGDNLPAVDLGTGKTAVWLYAGGGHNCAILNDGSLKCWGSNGAGQLGLGDTNQRGDQPGEMGDSLPAVNLGTGKTAITMQLGWQKSCALLQGGGVKCWGWNAFGSLGLGDTNNRGDNPGEMGDNLPMIDLGTGAVASEIGGPSECTCALLNGGRVKCWGRNDHGQLGLGDTKDRGDNPGEMGNNLPFIAP